MPKTISIPSRCTLCPRRCGVERTPDKAAGMCAIAWLLVKIVRHPLGQWSLAIILGGGIGNLIDRVRLGYVVDMLDTMFMDFPVFNVADVFVVCGTVCALIYYLAFYSKSDEKNWGNKVDGTDPAANK